MLISLHYLRMAGTISRSREKASAFLHPDSPPLLTARASMYSIELGWGQPSSSEG